MSDSLVMMLSALGAEILLLALIVLGISFYRNRAARRRDQRAIQTLVERVRQQRPEREKAIGQYLEQRLGLTGGPLEQAREGLMRAELELLKRFALIYQRREADRAACFDADLIAALHPYHALDAGDALVVQQDAGGAPDDSEVESLRQENTRLADELKTTMEAMSRMLSEYSAMFGGGSPGGAASSTETDDGHPGDHGADAAAASGDLPDNPTPPPAAEDMAPPADDVQLAASGQAATDPGTDEDALRQDAPLDEAPAPNAGASPDEAEVAMTGDDEDLFDPVAAGEEDTAPGDGGEQLSLDGQPSGGRGDGDPEAAESAGPDDEDLFDALDAAAAASHTEEREGDVEAEVTTASEDEDLFDALEAAGALSKRGEGEAAESVTPDDEDLFDLVETPDGEASDADDPGEPGNGEAPLRSRSVG